MNFTSPIQITAGQSNAIDTVQQYMLGTKAVTRDGREFRYVQAGLAPLVPGNALQGPVVVPLHQANTAAVQVAGATSLTMTLGATAATANQYVNGSAVVSGSPGNGYVYAISGHPAANSGASLTVQLYPDDPVQVATSAASKISLIASPYAGVIQTPITTLTGVVVGGAVTPIPASGYGWIQTRGVFAGLIDGSPAAGMALSCPGAAAGAFAINSGTLPMVGFTLVAGVTGQNYPIFLTIS